jgi:hypothetical protein
VLPALFAEPITLELKKNTWRVYLHAQIFAGCMFFIAVSCLWFVRAWKIKEIRRLDNEGGKVATSRAARDAPLRRVPANEATSGSLSSLYERSRWMKFVKRLQELAHWERV